MPFPFIAAATLAAGAMAYAGGKQQSTASLAGAREQMAFQERMSSTAHQREIEDLRKAGLNPILSSRYGGSSTPSGAQPQIIPNIAGRAASSALSAYQGMQGVKKVRADIRHVDAMTKTEGYRAEKEYSLAKQAGASMTLMQAQTRMSEIQQVLEAFRIPGFSNEAALQGAIGPIIKAIGPASTGAGAIKSIADLLKGGFLKRKPLGRGR